MDSCEDVPGVFRACPRCGKVFRSLREWVNQSTACGLEKRHGHAYDGGPKLRSKATFILRKREHNGCGGVNYDRGRLWNGSPSDLAEVLQ